MAETHTESKQELVTRSQLADIMDINRQAISYAIKKKQLKLVGEGSTGKIDMNDPKTRIWIDKGAKDGRRNRKKKEDPEKRVYTKKDAARTQELKEKVQSDILPPVVGGDDGEMKITLDNQKIQEQILQLQIKNREARKELISRALVERAFHAFYSIDTNQIRTLEDKLSSEICAICGVDDPLIIVKAKKRVGKEVFKILNHIKREKNKFLKSVEGEEIAEDDQREKDSA